LQETLTMNKSWIILTAVGGIVIGAAVAATAQDRTAIITASRAEAVSAADDGTAWVLTSRGGVMFCRFEGGERVRCFDRAGVVDSGY